MPTNAFSFIDLFAGIGGFRLGLSSAGGKALYTNEWDPYAAKTYTAWYGEKNISTLDIRKVDARIEIPDHDVLSAGFPCQPFSIAGVSKKNSLGRPHGFRDMDQGNLFFAICDVIAVKQPKIVLLENVRNLVNHDKGKTWEIICESLDLLGYELRSEIINSAGWVPQNRRRVFIVAFRRDIFHDVVIKKFKFPKPEGRPPILSSILEKQELNKKYMLTDNLWRYLQEYARKHAAKGNGFGYRLYGPNDVAGTLSARYYKDGAEILIKQEGWRNPRRLTPSEAARLMGFNRQMAKPLGFKNGFPQVVSDMQSYKQFGNSVSPLIAHEIGIQLAKALRSQEYYAKKEKASRHGR